MAGAWELLQQKQVLVGILHTDNTTIAWSLGLRNLQIPGQILPVAGMPYDQARNTICQATLNNGFQWLFFLDSDVIPPRDAILRLMAHQKPLISGVYARRSPPHAIPVMLRGGQWIVQYPKNTVIEVDLVGAGCLLIHRSLLEKCPPQRPGHHWFDWRVNQQGLMPPGECLSEDFTFNVHVKRTLGIPTLVDTSVECRHCGMAQATPGNFVPLETNTNT